MIKKLSDTPTTCRKTKMIYIARLLFLFLFLKIGIVSATSMYSQVTTLSLNVNSKSVKDVFTEIEKKTEYVFFYYDDVLDVNRKVNISVKEQTLDKVLEQLFADTDNTYYIEDKQVFIAKAGAEAAIRQQQKGLAVNGTVVDAKTAETLPGVSITVKSFTTCF